MKFQNIKESPDIVFPSGGLRRILDWNDDDAYAFGMWDNGDLLIEKGATHDELSYLGTGAYEAGVTRGDYRFPGRLWTESRVIAFWDYPRNMSELKKIATFINMKIGVNIMSPKWQIEIKEGNEYKLIPILDFDKSDELSASEKAKQHVVSPMLKKKVSVPSGVGSKHKKYDTPIDVRYKMNREQFQLLKKLIRESIK